MVGKSDGREATIPAGLNMAVMFVLLGANLFLFAGLPLLLAQGHAGAAWLALPVLLTTMAHWALVHEAVHGHLHPRPARNEAMARLLGVFFLAPFDNLRFGHLSHHALNARPTDRPELYDPRDRSRLRAALVFYPRLLIGIYLLEVASGLLSLLPRRVLRRVVRQVFYEGAPDAAHMADRAERVLLSQAQLRRIRLDAIAILTLLAGSFAAYGTDWHILFLTLLGRGFIVSFMDNAPHYAGPLGHPDQGFDMHLPFGLGRLVLNSNLHGTHHRYPNLPWTALPAAFAADGKRYAGSYLLLPWRQIRGPVPLDAAASS